MKIAIISDRVYPYFKGGAEKRSWDISKKLVEKGHKIVYYTGQWKGMKKEENHDKIKLKKTYKVGNFYKNGKKSIIESIKYSLSLPSALLNEDFDLIDADQMPVMHIIPLKLISLIKNKPLYVTWHEVWGKKYWQSYIGKGKGAIGALVEKLASKMPDKIISVSNLTTQRLTREFNVKKDKIVTIPNGIDIVEINKAKPSKEKSDVIFAGRLLAHKNVNLLIMALKMVKNSNKKNKKIKLIIIGDGPEKNNLIKLAKQEGLSENITFKGFLDKEQEVYSLMKSSKVFALPSEREGFGIAAIEANACGIPVVTVAHKDNATVHLIEEGKNGFIASLQPKSLASNIEKAIKLSNTMKKNCIDSAEKYDLNLIVNKLERSYKE